MGISGSGALKEDISAATSVKSSEISHPILTDGTCSRSTEESAAKSTVVRILPYRKSLRKTLNSILGFIRAYVFQRRDSVISLVV